MKTLNQSTHVLTVVTNDSVTRLPVSSISEATKKFAEWAVENPEIQNIHMSVRPIVDMIEEVEAEQIDEEELQKHREAINK